MTTSDKNFFRFISLIAFLFMLAIFANIQAAQAKPTFRVFNMVGKPSAQQNPMFVKMWNGKKVSYLRIYGRKHKALTGL